MVARGHVDRPKSICELEDGSEDGADTLTSYKTSRTLDCRDAEAVSVRLNVLLNLAGPPPHARRGEA